MRTSLCVFIVWSVACTASAVETYQNPIIEPDLADPAVIKHDGTTDDAEGRLTGRATRGTPQPAPATRQSLWQLAQSKQDTHRFSTLVTAPQVRDYLGTEQGIKDAIDWCQETGVTKVYIETFRSNYLAPREILQHAKQRFLAAGFDVSGCVTTTIVGKQSTGWNLISCYTDAATQDHLQEIFEYTGSLFDEIMIDDFWFTDCQCTDCDAARQAKTVTIGPRPFPSQVTPGKIIAVN